MKTALDGTLKALREQKGVCIAQPLCETKNSLVLLMYFFFFPTLQKLVETNSCGQKVNKRPTLWCASVEKRRSTQSDCITSGFPQDKLSLLWTVSSSCIVLWGDGACYLCA